MKVKAKEISDERKLAVVNEVQDILRDVCPESPYIIVYVAQGGGKNILARNPKGGLVDVIEGMKSCVLDVAMGIAADTNLMIDRVKKQADLLGCDHSMVHTMEPERIAATMLVDAANEIVNGWEAEDE